MSYTITIQYLLTLAYQIWLKGDNRFLLLLLLPHPHPTFRMAGIPTYLKDEIESKPGGIQNNGLEAHMELYEWWKTVLEIFAGIESPETRTKFLEFVNHERKDQVHTFNLDCLTTRIIETT